MPKYTFCLWQFGHRCRKHKVISVSYTHLSVVNMQQHLTEMGVENRMKVFEGGGHLWFGNELETARTLTIDWFKEKL